METDRVSISIFGSIFLVADNRMADGAELGADLVVAARLEFDAYLC